MLWKLIKSDIMKSLALFTSFYNWSHIILLQTFANHAGIEIGYDLV